MSDQAVRLTFSYDGSNVQLLSQQKVSMVPPPSDPTDELSGASGFWFDVRDGQGSTVYRRLMHSPIRTDVEVFSDGPAQSIHRVPIDKPHGVFTVVIPDIDGAESLSFHSGPSEGADSAPATLLSTFKLADK